MPTEDEAYWDRRFTERGWPTEPDPLLVEQVRPLAPGRALDVASGPGRNSLWLAGRGWAVTAVDASGVALRRLTELAGDAGTPVRTVHADVLGGWTPPSQGFDLVVVANLHPLPAQMATLLGSLADALAPGGHLLVIGHDLANLGRQGPPDPERLLTPGRLGAALPPTVDVERLERVRRAPDDVAVLAWAVRPYTIRT